MPPPPAHPRQAETAEAHPFEGDYRPSAADANTTPLNPRVEPLQVAFLHRLA